MKKYTLRKDLKLKIRNITLYCIERISTKELGGFVETEANLSQEGNAWVADNAQVSGDAQVSDNAQVFGSARVSGNAQVYGGARVSGDARVTERAQVSGNARVSGDASIFSTNELINFTISNSFPITITPDNIAIGCLIKKRNAWLKITIDKAEKMGLPRELFPHYKQLLNIGMKLVPKRKKTK